MKFIVSQLTVFLKPGTSRRNIRLLLRFLVVLACVITVYAATFHLLMRLEGQEHSWLSGFYWALTVMSTLGFGDITFTSDIGRLFSIVVLLSGMIFLLVLLPFTFIEFFYAPWMQAQSELRAPRQLPLSTEGACGPDQLRPGDSGAHAQTRSLQISLYPFGRRPD